jgi:hypothetical protein
MSYDEDRLSPQEAYDVGYDKGFADAKDYWQPKRDTEIIEQIAQLPTDAFLNPTVLMAEIVKIVDKDY